MFYNDLAYICILFVGWYINVLAFIYHFILYKMLSCYLIFQTNPARKERQAPFLRKIAVSEDG